MADVSYLIRVLRLQIFIWWQFLKISIQFDFFTAYHLSVACFVFEILLGGGGRYPTSRVGTKLAQAPVGKRVNLGICNSRTCNVSLTMYLHTYSELLMC